MENDRDRKKGEPLRKFCGIQAEPEMIKRKRKISEIVEEEIQRRQ